MLDYFLRFDKIAKLVDNRVFRAFLFLSPFLWAPKVLKHFLPCVLIPWKSSFEVFHWMRWFDEDYRMSQKKSWYIFWGFGNSGPFLAILGTCWCPRHQGGRSCTCTGAGGAPAEKFGLGRKFEARTYAVLSRIKVCRDLRTFGRPLGEKVPLWVKISVSWARNALLHGIYCIFYWV